MSWCWSVPLLSDIKRKSNETHILSNDVSSQGVTILLVKCHGFLHLLSAFYPKLHFPLDIFLSTTLFHLIDNPGFYPQHVLFPPVESRFIINIFQYCILFYYNQVSFLHIQ